MEPTAVLIPEPGTAPAIPGQPGPAPDHKQLPQEDETAVHNTQEHPQSNLVTECIRPRLLEIHPDGMFCIGCDVGIYWRLTIPYLNGCKAPDWFYVPGVPPMLDGEVRRSYVLWQEVVKPLIVIEYVSGDGTEERDPTPFKGKFWVYEQAIGVPFYAIYEVEKATVEVYQLLAGRYQRMEANAAGRFPIPPLGIELGIWEGSYRELYLPWLRIWDAASGVLMPLADERADLAEDLLDDARRMVQDETERAENERARADKALELVSEEKQRVLLEKQRADEEKLRAELEKQRADEEKLRADEEKLRADEEKQRAAAAADRARILAAKLRELGFDPDA